MQRTQWKWDTEYKEGIQQDVISNSVEVNIKNRVTIASLPLTQNPAVKPAPNNENLCRLQSANTKVSLSRMDRDSKSASWNGKL